MQKQSKQQIYNTSLKGKYRILKNRNKRPGLLTFEEYCAVVTNARCFYCAGALPTIGYGLDRISSKRGYTKANVIPCCSKCNSAKNNMTIKQFLTHIETIYVNCIKIYRP